MPSPILDERTGIYFYRPTYQGSRQFISLGTDNLKKARLAAAEIDKRIWSLANGIVAVPAGLKVEEWIKSGDNAQNKRVNKTLKDLIEKYKESTPHGSKAESTLATERIHFRRLAKILGDDLKLSDLTHEAVLRYVATRLKDKYRDRPIKGPTIKLELVSLRQLWGLACSLGWVAGTAPPTKGVKLPRQQTKEPFLTLGEIENLIRANHSNAGDLWERCVLLGSEISEFLKHVHKLDGPPVLYPMIASAAYTGMRRSELTRSNVDDWDLGRRLIRVQEKKRVHERNGSLRYIEIHEELLEIIRPYIGNRKVGPLFSEDGSQRLEMDEAHRLFESAVASSKWTSLKGWHTLRHSFASNLAAGGADPAVVSSFMGHETEEQKARYRHFFPAERKRAIDCLDYSTRLPGRPPRAKRRRTA